MGSLGRFYKDYLLPIGVKLPELQVGVDVNHFHASSLTIT